MRSDLDHLMEEARLDAILVLGSAQHNPPMHYLIGGGHVTDAALFKKAGEQPVIYCNAMEREEAAKSGYEVVPLSLNGVETLLKEPRGILKQRGLLSGRLGVYGNLDAGNLIAILRSIESVCPELELTGEPKDNSLFLRAMETKDESEIAHIRRMGQITTEVVDLTAKFLMDCDVREDGVLVSPEGSPITVADVKRRISLWLAEREAEEVEGCIFAIGRDAGIPHSEGSPHEMVRLGRTIVFDIFPAEAGGGYFYDFTRTWSLGYATPEAKALHEEVRRVYDKVVDNLDLNTGFKEYQKLACEEFHAGGHQTPMHDDGVLTHGYVHSLGHGVGLNVHERPWSRHTASDDNILKPGVVITIEPGLYYPDREIGARIEDTYWVRPDGTLELLSEYPYDLVLPMPKWKGRAPST